ncbi:aldo/keto reductase [Propioniciclava sinopodophylli]|uniref:Aldo/keto reductase n=1 Tax=Propioniciclava sinopodophylli TaxID=1837344 RepID=A0A4Q9KDG1_9ACTN|nr:aldo/keto reductase [Propioniciclava sinopodophylli]TBT83111.1 aldo/keto reductase [Propioniciclava sinopodophylli]
MSKQRRIGQFSVSGIGLGGMPFSLGGDRLTHHEQGIATVHAALDAGITLIDTADIYAPAWDQMGHNERIVAEGIRTWTGDASNVVVATKGGITRHEGNTWGRDSSPDYLRAAAHRSRDRLGVERIDLYYLHRPDRTRLYADAIEVLAGLRADGVISEIGISNANVEEVRIALDVLGEGGLAAVQNEFSPKFNHTSYPELLFCGERGIAFVPWSPLGGVGGGHDVGDRFPVLAEVADAHGVSPQVVTLAWELSLGDHVVPIPGASRPASITDSAKALDLELTPEELERISATLLQR